MSTRKRIAVRRRRWRLAVVTVVTAVMLSGCYWSNPGYGPAGGGYNPGVSGITPENVGTLAEAWHRDWPGGTEALPVVESRAGLHTVVNGDPTQDDPVAVALAPRTGAVSWQTTVPKGLTNWLSADDVSMVEGKVTVSVPPTCSVCEPHTTQFDAQTGAYLSDCCLAGSYVVDAGHHVVSLSSKLIPDPVTLEAQLAISSNGSATSFARLRADTSSTLSRVAVGPDDAYFSLGPLLYAALLDPEDPSCADAASCFLGTADLDGNGTAPVISADGQTVYVATAAGTLDAFDAVHTTIGSDGLPHLSLRWQASVGGSVTARPALSPDGLVVARTDGTVAVFDPAGCGAATCTPKWTTTVPDSVTQQPTIAGGLVYVASAASSTDPATLSAFPMSCATGCSALWSTDTGLVLSGPVVVSSRNLVVASGRTAGATGNARVVAYRPS